MTWTVDETRTYQWATPGDPYGPTLTTQGALERRGFRVCVRNGRPVTQCKSVLMVRKESVE